MKRLLILTILVFLAGLSSGQGLTINPGVDTLDTDAQKALSFYRQYLNEFKGQKIPEDFNKYWSQKDCREYKIPDPAIYSINSDFPIYTSTQVRTIMSIKPQREYVHIKTFFGWVNNNNVTALGISNHYIGIDRSGKPVFLNPLELNTKNWSSTTVSNVTFCHPPSHTFNKASADNLIRSIRRLEKEWDLKPISIQYYFAGTREEIDFIRGLNFSIMAGNRSKASGMADEHNNIVYSTGLGENYFHEVVHIYLNRLYPGSPLKEGLAVFYGGSMGKGLDWHVNRVKKYLVDHPEIDLNKPDDFWYMDNLTNPESTIMGTLCSLAHKKDGITGLKKIMEYTTMEEIFSKEFGVKRDQWNGFLRQVFKDN